MEYMIKIIRIKIIRFLYYFVAIKLPYSDSKWSFGSKKIRGNLAKNIVKQMGENVNIEKGAYFSPDISIGNNSGIGIRCELYGPISIGDNVLMAPEVVIYTVNHKHNNLKLPIIEQGNDEIKPVKIGNNVWIGRRAIILPGVSIGDGCIIGAGAVVSKSIESNSVAVGTPARIVKKRE